MLNTFYDSYNILNKVYVGGAFLKQALTETVIEEKNRAKITKICYGVLDKDVALEYYLALLCDKKPKNSVKILLKIGMFAIKYLENQPYAVVDNMVKLVKKMGKGGTSGFVNAVLRKFSVCEPPYIEDEIKRLSVEYSYPEFAVKRLIKDYGKETAIEIINCDEERTTVRFCGDFDGEKYLQSIGAKFELSPFKNTFITYNFKRNADYDKGVYTFQSIGSVAICDAVPAGEKLFDACAAPGGKSVNLADKFKEVVASDIHPHRVKLIEEYAARMNKPNVKAVLGDSSIYNAEYKDAFDCVLCDAPCSGYGVVKENPDIKLNRTDEDIKELAKLQLKLLENVALYVKAGGYLCYSTCSVFKEENEEICKEFLKSHGEYKEIKTVSPLRSAESEIGKQFLPHLSLGAGFYYCLFKREKQ
ncbi:MAG: hypothetical protein J5836_00865 [Clostridia bacterium]|nr:hypothetical protein [Clostridia bacterium]